MTLTGFVTCFEIESCYTAMLQDYVVPQLHQQNALNDTFFYINPMHHRVSHRAKKQRTSLYTG